MARATSTRRATPAHRHGRGLTLLLQAVAEQVQPAPALARKELPWLQMLDREHLRRFLGEYADAYRSALDTGEWQSLDELLGDWEATAEALHDPGLRRLLREDQLAHHGRIRLEYPA